MHKIKHKIKNKTQKLEIMFFKLDEIVYFVVNEAPWSFKDW